MDRLDEREWQHPILGEIAELIASGDGAGFERAALNLARLHYERDPLYRRLCEMRGVTPGAGGRVEQLPAVPTEAFKRKEMHVTPEAVVRRFHTSGTSRGEGSRGTSCFSDDDLALMDLAIDANAERYLFPDHETVRTTILILAPPPEAAPRMIMAWGMDRLRRNYGDEASGFLVGPEGLDFPRLLAGLEAACSEGRSVTLIGASFGFVNLFDAMAARGLSFALPEGSRAMDAGGFKGRSREVGRAELAGAMEAHMGIPPARFVNLLGLTEHASQFYDDGLAAEHEGRPAREGKQHAPWTRTWATDPGTLEVLPHGETGLLRHLDLANGGHPFVVQTDDLGVTSEEGFVVVGRAGGAESRGCSLTVDELVREGRGL